MAHRSQWNHLRPCILSIFQRHSSKARSTHCDFLISHLSLWRTYLEYVPVLCQRNHFLGRTSQRSDNRNDMRHSIHGVWASTTGPRLQMKKKRKKKEYPMKSPEKKRRKLFDTVVPQRNIITIYIVLTPLLKPLFFFTKSSVSF